MSKAAVMNKSVEKGCDLDDAEVLQVVASLVKQRRDSIEQFTKRAARISSRKRAAELTVLQAYLPPAATPEEINAAVAEAIAETGASSPKDMGKVMKAVHAEARRQATPTEKPSTKPSGARLAPSQPPILAGTIGRVGRPGHDDEPHPRRRQGTGARLVLWRRCGDGRGQRRIPNPQPAPRPLCRRRDERGLRSDVHHIADDVREGVGLAARQSRRQRAHRCDGRRSWCSASCSWSR